jgi:hypothetical protein
MGSIALKRQRTKISKVKKKNFFLRYSFPKLPRLALNWPPSCLSHPNGWVTGITTTTILIFSYKKAV